MKNQDTYTIDEIMSLLEKQGGKVPSKKVVVKTLQLIREQKKDPDQLVIDWENIPPFV
jgi:hypothetical protein